MGTVLYVYGLDMFRCSVFTGWLVFGKLRQTYRKNASFHIYSLQQTLSGILSFPGILPVRFFLCLNIINELTWKGICTCVDKLLSRKTASVLLFTLLFQADVFVGASRGIFLNFIFCLSVGNTCSACCLSKYTELKGKHIGRFEVLTKM